MIEKKESSIEEPVAKPKLQWQSPSLTLLGNVAELVQGGGKSGVNADADPTATTKAGGG
jgi:hypothetical protein